MPDASQRKHSDLDEVQREDDETDNLAIQQRATNINQKQSNANKPEKVKTN